MGFFSFLKDRSPLEVQANTTEPPPPPPTVGGTGYTPGDPNGLDSSSFDEDVTVRSLPWIVPSGWDGWPGEWGTPCWDWGSKFNALIDVAWTCLDLNSSVLSSMPVFRTRSGQVIPSTTWMTNPDPTIYTSWHEFAKQLFWDYQCGEAFVVPVQTGADRFPLTFRVLPPWMVHVELERGVRRYWLGQDKTGREITDEVLHIRYKSATDCARGIGPLDMAGLRMVTAGVLSKYIKETAEVGGVPNYTLETDTPLNAEKAEALKQQWLAKRMDNAGAPPVLDSGTSLQTHQSMSPRDMVLLEIAQFTESRIAVLLRVPPFLVGLPSGGDSLTYSNVSSLFDFHDRSGLRPMAAHVMAALSDWALPSPQQAELNRDEYTRPSFTERADAWVKLIGAGVMSVEEVRAAERLEGDAPTLAPTALTGGES